MSINWFPGHMHKATREIRERLPDIDVIIQVVDARLPYSSANPVIAALSKTTPCLKVLSKSDLADPHLTEQWLTALAEDERVNAMAVSTQQPASIKQLVTLCKRLPGVKANSLGEITALITGIPNVGKSTLINTLAGRIAAKAGNEPAVTQRQQRIDLRNGLVLIDSPGILWPKIDNPNSGYRLALSGAIKATAMSESDVGLFAAEFLLAQHPDILRQRYQLTDLPANGTEVLEAIGRRRGCLGSGGHVDFERTGTLLINEYRNGKLGRLTLETPDQVANEEGRLEQIRAKRAAEKDAQAKQRKQAFKDRQQQP